VPQQATDTTLSPGARTDVPALAAIAFYAWTIVYAVSPFAVFAIWWRNRATDPRTRAADDRCVPAPALIVARAFAAGVLAAGLLAFVVPQVAIDVWPWQLTPLTARVLAGLTVQVGVAALILSGDPRWSAWRLIVQTLLVATALLLIGAVRPFGVFDTSNPLTWLYLGGLLGTAGCAHPASPADASGNRVGPIDPGGSRWPSPESFRSTGSRKTGCRRCRPRCATLNRRKRSPRRRSSSCTTVMRRSRS
jgi:hypothetical protein